jgi:hypothetical protein
VQIQTQQINNGFAKQSATCRVVPVPKSLQVRLDDHNPEDTMMMMIARGDQAARFLDGAAPVRWLSKAGTF